MKPPKDPLAQARQLNAEYAGVLARWAGLTGHVPPFDVQDRDGHILKSFTEWLERMQEEHRNGNR